MSSTPIGEIAAPIGNSARANVLTALNGGYADLVAFGRPFIANPDLPYRLAQGLPLAAFDRASLFGGGEHGYTDYQTAREAA